MLNSKFAKIIREVKTSIALNEKKKKGSRKEEKRKVKGENINFEAILNH